MMKAICSTVHCEAATNRSPSFSRSSSSVTTTISPLANALIAVSTRLSVSDKAVPRGADLRARLERPRRPFANLTAMQEIMVGQHTCYHRLADRHRPNTDARVVTALRNDIGVAAVAVDRFPRRQNRGCRLHRKPGDD